jgi:hypothetical protein
VSSAYGTQYVGRINIPFASGGGTFQQIGKIYLGTLSYYNPNVGVEQKSTSYEVLSCQ